MTGLSECSANLGYEVTDQTVGNVLRRHGIPLAPERKHTTTWAEFIRTHLVGRRHPYSWTTPVLDEVDTSQPAIDDL
jgi:hypothetical protein